MGLAIGPTLGSLIYEEVDYLYTFVIFGFLLVIGGVLIIFALPNRLNKGFIASGENLKNTRNPSSLKDSTSP